MVEHLGLKTRPWRLRLGEQVAELLLAAIRLHEFLPGERLPSERELCARLAVNRSAVREGLRWLEQHRYIEIRRGKYGGAFVLNTPADLALERIRNRIPELRQVLEYRAMVEPIAARLAAQRIGDPELQHLRDLHRREQTDLGLSRIQLRAIDVELHETVARASQNQYVFQAVREMRLRVAEGLDVTDRTLTRRRESQAGHTELIQALERHDPVAAETAMARHVAATQRAIAAALADKGIELWPEAVAAPVAGHGHHTA
jgi:GntR family transcriptional repressor for pyruvate dehydrogenase complex